MSGRDLSIVVPVFNSAEALPLLVEQLLPVLQGIGGDFELILVNDGSGDRSWDVVAELAAGHQWIRGINLMRNYGQHNAVLCGAREARFATIVTMDDDLQHPPEEIPKLLAVLDEGYDVVYGIPAELPHSVVRNLLSRVTKRAMSKAMSVDSIRDISAFRAFRTDLRRAFASYQSPQLLFDVLLSWGTSRFGSVTVRHDPRTIGRSNYTFGKLLNQALLILTGFTTAPLRLASLIGFAFTLLGVFVLIYVLAVFLVRDVLPGFAFLASMIAIFSGAQLFSVGIIGEYLARMFARTIERPTYVVADHAAESTEQVARDAYDR